MEEAQRGGQGLSEEEAAARFSEGNGARGRSLSDPHP